MLAAVTVTVAVELARTELVAVTLPLKESVIVAVTVAVSLKPLIAATLNTARCVVPRLSCSDDGPLIEKSACGGGVAGTPVPFRFETTSQIAGSSAPARQCAKPAIAG